MYRKSPLCLQTCMHKGLFLYYVNDAFYRNVTVGFRLGVVFPIFCGGTTTAFSEYSVKGRDAGVPGLVSDIRNGQA